ncbi:hypothetical protein HQ585_18440 [candidate division KSB1 bacterium]|nr:hypothetical protein [candidate division KSB1 bacterium]
MKKLACVFLIILLGFNLAGAAELPNIYIYTGVTRPVAPTDFKDIYRTGVNVGIAAGKTLTNFLECDLHFSYHGTTFDVNSFRNTLDPETSEQYVIDGGPTHMLSTMLRAKLSMPSPEGSAMRSYFYAGAGMVIQNSKDITVLGPEIDGSLDFMVPGGKETVPGICGGLGIEYHIETTTLFLELGLISGFTEGEATVVLPFKFGIAIK